MKRIILWTGSMTFVSWIAAGFARAASDMDLEPLRLPTPSKPDLEVPSIVDPAVRSGRLRHEPLQLEPPSAPKPKFDSLPRLDGNGDEEVPEETDE